MFFHCPEASLLLFINTVMKQIFIMSLYFSCCSVDSDAMMNDKYDHRLSTLITLVLCYGDVNYLRDSWKYTLRY